MAFTTEFSQHGQVEIHIERCRATRDSEVRAGFVKKELIHVGNRGRSKILQDRWASTYVCEQCIELLYEVAVDKPCASDWTDSIHVSSVEKRCIACDRPLRQVLVHDVGRA